MAKGAVKTRRSPCHGEAMFRRTDPVEHTSFEGSWHTGTDHVADFLTKHVPARHHREARPRYAYENRSPTMMLPPAADPTAQQGCAGTLEVMAVTPSLSALARRSPWSDPDGHASPGPRPRVYVAVHTLDGSTGTSARRQNLPRPSVVLYPDIAR